jgi:hypothetical protein
MTVEGLIDYLQEFPGRTKVFLSEGDVTVTGLCDFIVLDVLDFSEDHPETKEDTPAV